MIKNDGLVVYRYVLSELRNQDRETGCVFDYQSGRYNMVTTSMGDG